MRTRAEKAEEPSGFGPRRLKQTRKPRRRPRTAFSCQGVPLYILQPIRQLGRKGSLKLDYLAPGGTREPNTPGMQKKSVAARISSPVEPIPRYRMSDAREMDPDLMRPPGSDLYLDIR